LIAKRRHRPPTTSALPPTLSAEGTSVGCRRTYQPNSHGSADAGSAVARVNRIPLLALSTGYESERWGIKRTGAKREFLPPFSPLSAVRFCQNIPDVVLSFETTPTRKLKPGALRGPDGKSATDLTARLPSDSRGARQGRRNQCGNVSTAGSVKRIRESADRRPACRRRRQRSWRWFHPARRAARFPFSWLRPPPDGDPP